MLWFVIVMDRDSVSRTRCQKGSPEIVGSSIDYIVKEVEKAERFRVELKEAKVCIYY